MTKDESARAARLAKRLARTRTRDVEIVIESGAGSIISRNLSRVEMNAMRRSAVALRETAAALRRKAESELDPADVAVFTPGSGFTIFTKPADVQSNATLRAFDRKGIPHTDVDVTERPEALEYLKRLGYAQAPVVITDSGDLWTGYRPDIINEISSEHISKSHRGERGAG